jgi:nondiscriminating glutamyl-tRNA synthetase
MKRVRFAPSPTGHLHIGGARTALFNYLYARSQQGQFILRIEDTDQERSSPEMAAEILEAMRWLGLYWDEGPVYQSERFETYRKRALDLLEAGAAYRCFCTPEEIEARLAKTVDGKRVNWKYDRRCLRLSAVDIRQKLEAAAPFALRFQVPAGRTFFKDRLHKDMEVDNDELEDFVILKPDGSPTYHLSVVVDDNEMGITHVIRGDDHISNTFKQVLLYRAFQWKPPQYAHLPLILGPDKKKLSKRHGETSVLEFKRQGYLPEAVVTYLAQLSWQPGDDRRVFGADELAQKFSLAKVSGNSPVFDYDRLKFVNSLAIQQRDSRQLYHLLAADDRQFEQEFSPYPLERKTAFVDLIKSRMKTLLDLKEKFYIYLKGQLDYRSDDLAKLSVDDRTPCRLRQWAAALQAVEPFDAGNVEERLRACADGMGIKAADLIHPSRFALVASTISPSIFELFAFMGKQESIERIDRFIHFLESNRKER